MEEAVRLREPNRRQLLMRAEDLDSLIGPAHAARAIWRVLERMDLTRFYQAIKAREGSAGRDATDPKMLLALWLYGLSEGINSARELERLWEAHAAYRWICGGGSVNYHTLGRVRTQSGRGWAASSDRRSLRGCRRRGAASYRSAETADTLQSASDTQSRIIVGVGATNSGLDSQQLEPMQDQIERRTQATPQQNLADGGYQNFAAFEHSAQRGIEVFSPPRQHRTYKINPLEVQPNDSPAIAAWRRRMASPEGQAIYRERAATAQTVNADLKTCRVLDRLVLPGITKVLIG